MVPGKPNLRRGIGIADAMHGTAIPYLDMGGASIKMNDDGSFNLLVGATDLGTGSDTVLAQMAGEVLGVPIDDIIVYSSDTDFTPFDKGAYASSTTFISGAAVVKAAQQVAERIRVRAAQMFKTADPAHPVKESDIVLHDRKAIAPDGRSFTMEEIALQFVAPGQSRADHGRGFLRLACGAAAVCGTICRSDRGYRDRKSERG